MQSSFFFGCVLVKTFKTVFKNIHSLSFNLFTHTHIYIYIYEYKHIAYKCNLSIKTVKTKK